MPRRTSQGNRTTKGRTFPVEILSRDEVQALMAACSRRAPTGVRNRALLAVLYRSGLRISEALDLMAKDFDLEGGCLTVLRGKGGKRRTVGLDAGAAAMIERWFAVRAKIGRERGWSPARRAVFCTLAGRRLDPNYVRELLHRLAEHADIAKRVHPHGFRHTHAFELAAEGLPVNLIQAQLGHRSLATTEIYLRHVAPAHLIKAIGQRADWTP